jgi:hypothetical protein
MSYKEWRDNGMTGEWSSNGIFHGDNFYETTHHGKEPNVLFHLRVADHVDKDGKKGLLIDELQSDWHQRGKKAGYRKQLTTAEKREVRDILSKKITEEGQSLADVNRLNELQKKSRGVPEAPFKENWYQLGLKRAIKEAVDNGMERVYLTTGKTQVDRYDLSKALDSVDVRNISNGMLMVYASKDNKNVITQMTKPEGLADVIGKELADRALKDIADKKPTIYSGLDLQVGGEGMHQYYDKTYLNWLKKYANEHGATVGTTTLKGSTEPVYYLELNSKLQKSAKKGQSYKDGGSVASKQPTIEEMRAELAKGGKVKEPKSTVKAYKLFRVHEKHPGKLFPLFVDANTPVEMNKWVDAKEGEMSNGKVKSKIGSLAYRPGWHAGDLPIATHIGEKSDSSLTAPDQRPANHAWAEVEMPNDVDWQSVANERGTNAQGKVVPVKAHITDQIPKGGHYRYKTNPNMTGNWLIGGSMKVNRVLDDKEVEKINKAAGLSDLPRAQPFKKKKFGFASGGCVAPDEWKAEEHVNHKAGGGVVSLLRKHGLPAESSFDAAKKLSDGHRVFIVHDQDETPKEVNSVNDLRGYTPEQIYTVHPQHFIKHKADGGTIQGNKMDTPTLAQMRFQLNQNKNPTYASNIGIDQAVDMDPKRYITPNPSRNDFLPVGGVADSGGLPIGGVDKDNTQPGQQMMPAQNEPQPNQDGQPNSAPQGADGQQPGGYESSSPQGPTPPMGNLLSMTPQGQAMQAMGPVGGQAPAMARGGRVSPQQMAAIRAKMMMSRFKKYAEGGNVDVPYSETDNPGRILFHGKGHGQTRGIVVPRHMWEGTKGVYGKGKKEGEEFQSEGMRDINKARAEVYGSENRAPLTIGQVGRVHKNVLNEHFEKPMKQQIADENAALERLRAAKHIGAGANTLDKSEKLDTVKHERDKEGRSHEGFASKGVAGHSLYTSGHGANAEHHIINTCPGQTVGCGGGHDANGIIDTMKGTCFAPNAESQYVNASIRRACHEQAKHDPKMTRDWILAHTGSLRKVSDTADKKNVVTLFRPNVVDETDVSSRHVIRHLNKQRKIKDKPPIVANSYGKTNELHDPENGYFVTHSNVGPKVKHGTSIAENIARDKQRVRSTVTATDASGKDFENEQGNLTPPKGSYMVTDVKRKSPMQKKMEEHITHAKYWSTGRNKDELSQHEKDEGEEGHFNGEGEKTSEDQAHYGHITFDGKRYDYQKQHILHPRLVNVPERKLNKKTGKIEDVEHMIPTDSRFMDENFLPKNRYKTKNGKLAGHILMTTPTESTSNLGHETTFTHHVGDHDIEYAKKNNGEYEIDSPMHQAMAEGKEYIKPEPITISRKAKAVKKAEGGRIEFMPHDYDDDFNAFPERNYIAQHHLSNRAGVEDETEIPESLLQRPKD